MTLPRIRCQIKVLVSTDEYLVVQEDGVQKGLPSVWDEINVLLEYLVATKMLGDRRLVVVPGMTQKETAQVVQLSSRKKYIGKKSLDANTIKQLFQVS